MSCIFCEIIGGRSPASVIYRDDHVMAFMALQPSSAGECLVIPIEHIDHFTDVPDELAQRIMVVAQRIGRTMRVAFKPERVGMVVHGYGVPHAHLIIVPQHGPYDITSARFAQVRDGEVTFGMSHIPKTDRSVLDDHARILSADA